MNRSLEYIVTEKDKGITLHSFLVRSGISRNILVHLKKTQEGILKNGKWAYVNEKVDIGDKITINIIESDSSENIIPVSIPLSIVYEDEDILVLNKPANMPVHPSINNYGNTLANGVVAYYNEQSIPFVFRCVNRLDRDTSGLTVIAKNMLSSHILSKQVANRELHREYLAIAEGMVDESGTIDAPIARVAQSVITRHVSAEGERAVTHYKRIAYRNGLSLVSLKLETGRTHQIRVHMKYIGHSLIGDFLYNPENTQMSRQALHSHRLTFTHPITNEIMDFIEPLPADMADFFL